VFQPPSAIRREQKLQVQLACPWRLISPWVVAFGQILLQPAQRAALWLLERPRLAAAALAPGARRFSGPAGRRRRNKAVGIHGHGRGFRHPGRFYWRSADVIGLPRNSPATGTFASSKLTAELCWLRPMHLIEKAGSGRKPNGWRGCSAAPAQAPTSAIARLPGQE